MKLSILKIQTPRVFVPLLQPARYKGVWGGRGSGKSHFFAEMTIEEAISIPGYRMVCVREKQKSLKESAKRLLEDKIDYFGVGSMFNVLSDRIETPGDGLIIFQGMQDHTAESIKSLEGFRRAWVEEAQAFSARSLELLRPTIRAPGSELWFSWNPGHSTDAVDKLLRSETPPPNSIVVKANYSDNPFFPDELEEERLYDKQTNPVRYGHIWNGDYEPTAVGAIWNRATLHDNRRSELPEMERIVVAVDPAISDVEGSDEHGIIVTGIGADGRGYVLADFSVHGSPRDWAVQAIAAYDQWSADAVVIEINQGGDMVRYTLESVRPDLPIIEVRATRGKHVRAEPISALYATDRISHVGSFPELEGQMCQMTAGGYKGPGSPDRVDALVWGFTELFDQMILPVSEYKKPRHNRAGGWMGS